MQGIGERVERPASSMAIENVHVGDRVLEAEIDEDEDDKNQDQDLRNLVLAA